MDIGVADESLNGIPYEESSESEEEAETEETEGKINMKILSISKKDTQKPTDLLFIYLFFRHFRSGNRNCEIKTHHTRTTDQFFEDG